VAVFVSMNNNCYISYWYKPVFFIYVFVLMMIYCSLIDLISHAIFIYFFIFSA